SHVFVLDPFADEPAPVQVTADDHEYDQVSWTPAGDLLFVTHRATPWNTYRRSDVYSCAADGSDLRRLTPGGQDAAVPAASADGGTVFYLAASDLGADAAHFVGRNGVLWSVAADRSGAATQHTHADNH